MKDVSPLTDAEKLRKYAEEVRSMLELQKEYFKKSAEFRKQTGSTIEKDVRDALEKSKAQEARVKKLTDKVLNPQSTLL